MRHFNRKSTPQVQGGRVLRKNNHKLTSSYWNTAQENIVIDVEKAGKGYKHFLKKRDILQFIKLIPNWEELSQGLDAIVLMKAQHDCDGVYYHCGVIGISAWDRDQDIYYSEDYYNEHKELFDRLGVKSSKKNGWMFCEFSAEQIKAYQLLHIFLHELGHHHDRMKTKTKSSCPRGENYAEQFAFDYEEKIWLNYQDIFDIVF